MTTRRGLPESVPNQPRGSLFLELLNCFPVSMSLERWDESLERAMRRHEEWLDHLVNVELIPLADLAWVVEQLVSNLCVQRAQTEHFNSIARQVAPCVVCLGTGITEPAPDFVGDDPKTMRIGTVSCCPLCHGSGVDPNYRADDKSPLER